MNEAASQHPKPRRIYVASSWRNVYQQSVVETLRRAGHQVYDFRHPRTGDTGFTWSAVDTHWESWDRHAYRKALTHPVAWNGFNNDYAAMQWADTGVLVLPSGRAGIARHGDHGSHAPTVRTARRYDPNSGAPATPRHWSPSCRLRSR